MKDEFLSSLAELVGPSDLLTGLETQDYCVDWFGRYRGAARCVVLPRSTEQVSAIVALCARYKVPIVPQGGNTSVCGGSVPEDDGSAVVLSLSKMNKIRHLDRATNAIVVEAGCILTHVQEAAAAADRLFPLSLSAEGSCQIGGTVSTNAGGLSVIRYGTMRDLVLGLEVVLPDGRIWDGLRLVRKDSTGVDLKGLWIGAEGTLGIVTAAALKLFPRPREQACAWVAFASPEAAVGVLADLQDRFDTKVTAFELMSRAQVAMVYDHLPGMRDPLEEAYPWVALIELSDTEITGRLSEALEDAIGDALQECRAVDAIVARSEQQTRTFWFIRHALTDALKAAGMSLTHDIAVSISAVPDYIQRTEQAVTALFPDARGAVVCHLGDGNVHYNLTFPRDVWDALPDPHARAEEVREVVQGIAVELSGVFVAEHGIGRKNLAAVERFKSSLELDLIQGLKDLLDPAGIMNPGKTIPVRKAPSNRDR